MKSFFPVITLILIINLSSGCKKNDAPKSSEKSISTFSFNKVDNNSLASSIDGLVGLDTIWIKLPIGTVLNNLVPSISFKGKSISPDNKIGQNFSNPVRYTVSAEDGSAKTYTVITSFLSTTKNITSFILKSADNVGLSSDIAATIINDTIFFTVSPDVDITHLIPTITIDGKYIYPTNKTVQDFTNSVNYILTAEDGSLKSYTVFVSANATVFSGSNDGYLYAIDAAAGILKWRYNIGNKIAGPAYSNGVVYAGSIDGNLYAIDASTGTLKWKFYDVQGYYNIPSVHYGKVFVNVTANGGNYLYALDEATGNIVWKKYAGGMSNLHPTVVNNMMYVANTSSVFAFDANTGVIKWLYDSGLAFANPTVANGVVYSNTEGSILTAINETTGAKIWEYSDPLSSFPVGKSPTLLNNVLYTGTTSSLYAINATDGTLKWKADWANTNFSCPVISNNVLFVYNVSAELTAVNINTGQIYWKAGSATTNPAAGNGVVYVGGGNNKLFALDGKSGAFKWSFQMSDRVIADPCIVDAKGNVFYSGDSGDQN